MFYVHGEDHKHGGSAQLEKERVSFYGIVGHRLAAALKMILDGFH